MKKQVITYEEENEQLMIVYGEEGKIIYVAIFPQNERLNCARSLKAYAENGYSIKDPDNLTDDELMLVLFDMTCLLSTTKSKREQK